MENNYLDPNKEMDVTNQKRENNARRQREYRERKRANLGESTYLESVAKYKRDLRVRKSGNTNTQEPQEPVTTKVQENPCDKLIKTINEKEGNRQSKSTTKTQVNRVSNLYKAMTGEKFDCKDYDWVNDTGKVLDFIENYPKWDSKDRTKQNSRNAYRTALASILRDLKGYERPQQLYSQYASVIYNKKIAINIGEGKLSVTQKKNYLPFEKLLDARKHFDKGTQRNAIVSIYTDTPPRRALDYQMMKVVKMKNKSVTKKYIESLKKDKDFNYVILDNKSIPTEFIFNNFKTVRALGTQKIAIPTELSKALQQYILTDDINNGDLLFATLKGKPYSNFSEVIKKAFKLATDKNVSVNLIRHSYITHFLKNKRTVNERKKLAQLMGHDINTQSLYEIIDEKD